MDRFSSASLIAATLACSTMTCGQAWAMRHHHHTRRAPEVYAATESDAGVPDQVARPVSRPKHIASRKSKKRNPDFDPVPSGEEDSVAARLQIIDKLIREYGRAYDYRSHTFKELQAILAGLESRDTPPAPPKLHDAVITTSDSSSS